LVAIETGITVSTIVYTLSPEFPLPRIIKAVAKNSAARIKASV
jgi:hypothetical protein